MDVQELIRKEGLRRGLSFNTIQTYQWCLGKFFRRTKKNPLKVTKEDLNNYLDLLLEKGRAGNTINVYVNAFKFLFEEILSRPVSLTLTNSKIPRRLPEFLTQEETARLFQAIPNPKHQLMIKLLYATGMRVNELTHLKIKDFQFDSNYGWVRQGKGKKDRLFVLAQKLKNELQAWINNNNLNVESWLFSGQEKEAPISTQTIRVILKQASKKAKITKHLHPHTLRHSFATHLIQNGYAVTEIQPLLGHNSLNTTMIYLHMASPNLLNVKSPYDTLNEDNRKPRDKWV